MNMESKEQQKNIDALLNNSISKIKEKISFSKKSVYISQEALDLIDPKLGDMLLSAPEEFLDMLKEVLIQNMIITEDMNVRISSLSTTQKISHIRHDSVGRAIMVKGIIRTVSSVKYLIKKAKFSCSSCGQLTTISEPVEPDTPLISPTICMNCGKRSKMKLVDKELIDVQKMTLEEDTNERDISTQTEKLECTLLDDLIDPTMSTSLTPGTKVVVTGILSSKFILRGNTKTVSLAPLFIATSVTPIEQMFSSIQITQEEEAKIIEMSHDPLLQEKLISSIAPEIFGNKDIKEAALLQLFSGGVKNMKKRSDIHILLVGEAGLAKTTMARSIAKIAPKSVFALGTASSKVGLTATVRKEDDDWVLEAGAMPLANGGLFVIDEIDKINNDDREALHEGLEDQSITINKANIHATLQTKVSLFAVANPKLGRFDEHSPLISQVDMPPTLLNRFDLIFILKDRLDLNSDKNIVDTMLGSREESPAITYDNEMIRKYIAYAKRITPIRTADADKLIKEFYLSVREKAKQNGANLIPISPRQLESILRLSIAHARLRLSATIDVEDVAEAISLITNFLKGVGIDPDTGQLEVDRATGSVPSSKRAIILEVKAVLKELALENPLHIADEVDIIKKIGSKLEKEDILEALQQLKMSSEIFEPSFRKYKMVLL
jgi:replicative DNA helicase Mcm